MLKDTNPYSEMNYIDFHCNSLSRDFLNDILGIAIKHLGTC